MAESQAMELLGPLEVLQAHQQRLRWAAPAAVIAITVSLLALIFRPNNGRWWSIHHRDGQVSARFDESGLIMQDLYGHVRARLGLFPAGDPHLRLFNHQDHLRAQVFVYPDGGGDGNRWFASSHSAGGCAISQTAQQAGYFVVVLICEINSAKFAACRNSDEKVCQ